MPGMSTASYRPVGSLARIQLLRTRIGANGRADSRTRDVTPADLITQLGLKGQAVNQALNAFAEHPTGTTAAALSALTKGDNPAGLFLRMLNDGDHIEHHRPQVAEYGPDRDFTDDELAILDTLTDQDDHEQRRARLEDAIREWRQGHVTDQRDAELTAIITAGLHGRSSHDH